MHIANRLQRTWRIDHTDISQYLICFRFIFMYHAKLYLYTKSKIEMSQKESQKRLLRYQTGALPLLQHIIKRLNLQSILSVIYA